MSTILFFMGKSGAGKSTLEQKLMELFPHMFQKVISYTTREKRTDTNGNVKEKDGLDYHFISKKEFIDMKNNNEFVQTTTIKDVNYGSVLSGYKSDAEYIILTVVPKEGEKLMNKLSSLGISNFKSVLFDITDERITSNLKNDGFSDSAIKERLGRIDLIKEFNETSLKRDIVIRDKDLTKDLPQLFVDLLVLNS